MSERKPINIKKYLSKVTEKRGDPERSKSKNGETIEGKPYTTGTGGKIDVAYDEPMQGDKEVLPNPYTDVNIKGTFEQRQKGLQNEYTPKQDQLKNINPESLSKGIGEKTFSSYLSAPLSETVDMVKHIAGQQNKGVENLLFNAPTELFKGNYKNALQNLFQGVSNTVNSQVGILSAPFMLGDVALRQTPLGNFSSGVSQLPFIAMSEIGQIPTKKGFELAKNLGIEYNQETQNAVNELAGTLAQFVIPGALGKLKFKRIATELKGKTPIEQVSILEKTKEELQQQRIERIKKMREESVYPKNAPTGEQVRPQNNIINRDPVNAPPETNRPNSETYNKLPSFDELLKQETPGTMQEAPLPVIDQYSGLKDLGETDNTFNILDKGVKESKKQQFKEQLKPKLDEWVNESKSPEDFISRIQREYYVGGTKKGEILSKTLVDLGYVREGALPDKPFNAYKEYYDLVKKEDDFVNPKWKEALDTELTDTDKTQATNFVDIKRHGSLNLNSVEGGIKLDAGKIRKGLNDIKKGNFVTDEAKAVTYNIKKAYEKGITGNNERGEFGKKFMTAEELKQLTGEKFTPEETPDAMKNFDDAMNFFENAGKEKKTVVEQPIEKPVDEYANLKNELQKLEPEHYLLDEKWVKENFDFTNPKEKKEYKNTLENAIDEVEKEHIENQQSSTLYNVQNEFGGKYTNIPLGGDKYLGLRIADHSGRLANEKYQPFETDQTLHVIIGEDKTKNQFFTEQPINKLVFDGTENPKDIIKQVNEKINEIKKSFTEPKSTSKIPTLQEFMQQVIDKVKPTDPNGKAFKEIWKKDHKKLVEKEIAKGKTIPDEVLKDYPELKNKLFTAERHEQVKAELKKKRGNLNSGLNPEEALLMAEYLGYYVEKGIRTLPEIHAKLRSDFGDIADYYIKNVDLKELANLTPYNSYKDWLKGQNDVKLEEKKNLGVTGKGETVGAYTQKTDKGFKVSYADYTPETSFAKEIGRVLSHKVTKEQAIIFTKEVKGLKGETFRDKFANAVKEVTTNPEKRKDYPELTKFLDEKDVPFTYENVKTGTVPQFPKTEIPRKKISREFESADTEKSNFKSLKNITSDAELNQLLTETGKKVDKTRGIMHEQDVKDLADLVGVTEKDILKIKSGEVRNVEWVKGAKQVLIDNANEMSKFVKDREKLTTEDAQILKEKFLTYSAIQTKVMGLVSESARVLQDMTRKVDAREFDTINTIFEELKKSGVEVENPVKMNKKIKEILDPSFKDKAVFIWYNSLLANPLTDVANITGNAGYLTKEILERIPTEPQNIPSMMRGFKFAWRDMKAEILDILKGEKQEASKYDFDTKTFQKMYDPSPKNIQNRFLKALGITGHAILSTTRLRIEDAIFRNIARNIEKEVGVKNISKEMKLPKETVRETLDTMEKAIENETKDIVKLSDEEKRFYQTINDYQQYARELTFIEPLGKTGQTFQKLTNSNPLLKWVFPFVRIAVNLTKEGFKQTPYYLGKSIIKGEFKDLSPRQKVTMIRRAVVGTGLISGLLALQSQGKIEITGTGPTDQNKKEKWLQAGYKPNHIYFGNTGLPYQNINPFGIILSVIGNVSDYQKYDAKFNDEDNDIWNKASLIIGKVSNTFLEQSFMQGAESLMTSFQKGDKNLLAKVLTSPLPNVGGIIRGFEGDYTQYNKEGIGDYVKFKLGLGELGITDKLKPRTDIKGENKQSPYRRFFWQTSDKKADEVFSYLLEKEIPIGMPTRPVIKGEEVNDEVFNEYQQRSGKILDRNLKIHFDRIKSYPEEYQDDIVERIASISREEAKKELENKNYKSKADSLIKDEIKFRKEYYKVNSVLNKENVTYQFTDEEKQAGKLDRERFKRLYLGGEYFDKNGKRGYTNGRLNDIKDKKGKYENMSETERANEYRKYLKIYKQIIQLK